MAKKYSCDVCKKRFKNVAAYEDHKKSDAHKWAVLSPENKPIIRFDFPTPDNT